MGINICSALIQIDWKSSKMTVNYKYGQCLIQVFGNRKVKARSSLLPRQFLVILKHSEVNTILILVRLHASCYTGYTISLYLLQLLEKLLNKHNASQFQTYNEHGQVEWNYLCHGI